MKKNIENWDWHWPLAIKLTKNIGMPPDEKYYEALTNKIMEAVENPEDYFLKTKLEILAASLGGSSRPE